MYYIICKMEMDELIKANNVLINENKELKDEVEKLKKELYKYSHSQKEYYENNKNNIMSKSNERLKKLAKENPDKIKEYRRKAYLKQKEKKKTYQKMILL